MLGRNVLAKEASNPSTRFVETYGGAVPKLPGIRAFLRDKGPQRRGVIHDGWKLILGSGPPVSRSIIRAELYYLPDDPNEEKDLAAQRPDRLKELTNLVEKWDEQCPHGHAVEAHLDADDVEALKSLGYLE
jgi:hypothetical protein